MIDYSSINGAATAGLLSVMPLVVPIFGAILTAVCGWTVYKWIKGAVASTTGETSGFGSQEAFDDFLDRQDDSIHDEASFDRFLDRQEKFDDDPSE